MAGLPILRNNSVDVAGLYLTVMHELDATVQSKWRSMRQGVDLYFADIRCACLVRSLEVDACQNSHVANPASPSQPR